MMWRNVSFVYNIELQFTGNVVTQSMDLGDVDNDGENELAVGNIDGDLAIFKGDSSMPTKRASNLGMITCVRIGDIFNIGKNFLVCLTAEGCCYVFDIKAISTEEDPRGDEEGHASYSCDSHVVYPAYTQNLPANCRAMLLSDTDGDGLVEMAVTYSDRVVRTFRWQAAAEHEAWSSLPFAGRLQLVDKWQLAGQIGAVTMDRNADGTPELLVSQPGRTYVTLLPRSPARPDATTPIEGEETRCASLMFHPLGHSRVRNKDVSTVIVGGIKRGKGCASTYHALASLDGTLVLVEKDKILWSLQVDHRLFVLDKLDVTVGAHSSLQNKAQRIKTHACTLSVGQLEEGNGQEEVVCCSWDGQTYIVNHSREVVRYHFKENVAAFTTGYYSVPGKGNVPCFVYATFKNQLYIHHSINLPCVESASLLPVMEKRQSTHHLLDKLGLDATQQDVVHSLYHWILYGWRPSK